jgi:hypothetical protein
MNRLLPAFAIFAVGADLVWLGFYLTGIVVTQIDYRAFGLSASAAFAPLMFLAWGLPTLASGLVAGSCLKHHPVRFALICSV